MPLQYNPAHARRWVPKAGCYQFEVVACNPTRFSTGSQGITIQLAINVDSGSPLRISEIIVFGERSTWKMLELCECLGVPFDPPCEAEDLVGKRGSADFRVDTDSRDGLMTLATVRYLPKPKASK